MNFPHARLRRALPVPLLRRLRAIHWQLCPPEPELALVSRFADPSRAFLDVGANTGVYLERALGRFAALYAVEPDPELAWYLERAFAGRVTVLALALSSRPGHMPFYLPHHAGQAIKTRGSLEADANPGLDQTVRTVPVATLDGLDLPPLGFVKIDVEGHELAVLEGGRERLRRDRPRLLIEIEERHHPGGSGRVFALLAELGYEAFYLADGRLKSLGETDLAVLQNIARAKPLTARARPARGYVNNFFFLHAEDTAARTALTRAVSEGDPSTGLSSGGRRRL
jgi:FkbM family methyltransferase